MENIKFFICPISKNITDSVLHFCKEQNHTIGLIPTRRQVEWDGGYANNWTTKNFKDYAGTLPLKRDHAGPSQGYKEDDGYASLAHDCDYFDFIHIDPWKKYPTYKEGLQWTLDMIKFCYNKNPSIGYEVGTEESIRPFKPEELHTLIGDLQQNLEEPVFQQIKYAVIQSGTSVKKNSNIGIYNQEKLTQMLKVVKSYNLLSKEHNGDYLNPRLLKEKMNLGLNAVNIGPELGLLETETYLAAIKDPILLNTFWRLCYDTGRWKRWVDADFDPSKKKVELIRICGHYVLTRPSFLHKIKSNFPSIDKKIQNTIITRLQTYYYE